MALESFPKTFNIVDEGKAFFPHAFNTLANINSPALPTLPPMKDYFYNSMKSGKRKDFIRWYGQNYNKSFYLKEKLVDYCLSDVRLLSEGLVRYRQIMLSECKFDVLRKCTTLAGRHDDPLQDEPSQD
jgi:hypothetical protein